MYLEVFLSHIYFDIARLLWLLGYTVRDTVLIHFECEPYYWHLQIKMLYNILSGVSQIKNSSHCGFLLELYSYTNITNSIFMPLFEEGWAYYFLAVCWSVCRSTSSFSSFSLQWLILKWNLVNRFIIRISRSNFCWPGCTKCIRLIEWWMPGGRASLIGYLLCVINSSHTF
jgi:hypothetical protein